MEEKERAYTGSFARIYDDIMGAVPYNLWYSYLQDLLEYYHREPEQVLDLACGTGNMTVRFARKGYQVSGLDRSGEMLEVARQKAEELGLDVELIQADLRDFHLSPRYDLAFSLFDSLNYILRAKDLGQVFSNVYQVLKPDGLFVFDLNTMQRLMSIRPGTTMFNGENYTCFWEDMVDRSKKRWQVKLKIYFGRQEGNYFTEFHEETAYPVGQVRSLLSGAGFKHVDVFNAYTFEEGTDDDNRIYYAAFKDGSPRKKSSHLNHIYRRIKWRTKRMLSMLFRF